MANIELIRQVFQDKMGQDQTSEKAEEFYNHLIGRIESGDYNISMVGNEKTIHIRIPQLSADICDKAIAKLKGEGFSNVKAWRDINGILFIHIVP